MVSPEMKWARRRLVHASEPGRPIPREGRSDVNTTPRQVARQTRDGRVLAPWTDADLGLVLGPDPTRLSDSPIPPELEEILDPFGDHDGPSLADLEWDMLESRASSTADPPTLPLLPFAEWIEVRASLIRLDHTDAARWLAAKLDDLAAMARRLHAETPDQYDARLEIEDDARDARLRAEGYDAAMRAAPPMHPLF
jgi:hypothetical protein